MVAKTHINFTEKVLAEIPVPTDKKPMTYYDTGQAGLCVIVTYGGTKTYYFYAQYLGDNKYEDSNISSIEQVSIYHKYDSPFLSLNGTTLSWSGVQNADSYSVYANYEGKKEVVFNTSGTSYDITTFINFLNTVN